MCRLFGLHAGRVPIDAEFWLLDAPDDLADQSRRNADGFGIGTFRPEGTPIVRKAPLPAWADRGFARAAHRLHGATFVAHVRHATTGAPTMDNTHPFLQDGRLFAHNGAVGDLPALEERLRTVGSMDRLRGDTDSERVFALITAEVRRHDGDVGAGIAAAVDWLRATVPVTSLNFVLSARSELWAFRYPAVDELFVLERSAVGDDRSRRSLSGSHLATRMLGARAQRSVVIASERMDDDAGWRPLSSGELLHVGADLDVRSTTVVDER